MGRTKLRLNRDRKKFLGVCAGIADYLEVEPWAVRLVFLVSVLMGAWFLVPVYLGFYFCLDNGSGAFRDNAAIKHLRNVDYRKKLYRNTREAKFLGVCAGFADYFEVDVTVVRVIVLVLLLVAGPIPWLAYFGAWFLLDPRPAYETARAEGRAEDFAADHEGRGGETAGFSEGGRGGRHRHRWHADEEGVIRSKRRDFRHCARKYAILHDRLARMEAYVTSPQFKLHREFKNMG